MEKKKEMTDEEVEEELEREFQNEINKHDLCELPLSEMK